jgi:hypothetical protein
MRNTAVYMALRGKRVVEWVTGARPGGIDQSTRQTPMITIEMDQSKSCFKIVLPFIVFRTF